MTQDSYPQPKPGAVILCPTCGSQMTELGSPDMAQSWICSKCSKLLVKPTAQLEAGDKTVRVYPTLDGLVSFSGELLVDTTQPERLDGFLAKYGGNLVKWLDEIKDQRPIQSFFKRDGHYLSRVYGGTDFVEQILKKEVSWVKVVGPLETDGGEARGKAKKPKGKVKSS